ncbi:hypothetical protein AsAng_0058720 [Aureispira anguillae]|uniref:Uncharacterized protein n=1 Tax=Aureispira anguillae TaxID=2864201 RepID=A0A915YKW7_9BACT|nr:hypothetical protein AsAng_0058720 [Aureispira anguillae]
MGEKTVNRFCPMDSFFTTSKLIRKKIRYQKRLGKSIDHF